MTKWLCIKLPSVIFLALMLLVASVFSGAAIAVEDLEIIQAVKNGAPATGANRVVMGEVFARDG